MSETILSVRTGAVTTITLNRPEVMNALTPAMLDGIAEAVNAASAEAETRVIVLTGAGRAFSAGVDLKALSGAAPAEGRVGNLLDAPAAAVATALRSADKPVIARVNGACFTGALEIVLHCDMVYTLEKAKFGDTHAKFALRPSWGMSQTLPQAVGLRRAKELSYTARTFTGAEAVAFGIANAALPSIEALDAHLAEICDAIVANDGATIAAYKTLHRLAEQTFTPDGVAQENDHEFPEILDTLSRVGEFLK
jgi:enoyl-CoA hydratase